MNKVPIVAISVVLIGCSGSPKMNQLSLNMTKSEVIKIMGQPDSTAAKDNVEYMEYMLWRGFWDRRPGDYSDPYFVRIVNGKVDAYGKRGDFDSTKTQESKQTIDLNINK